MHEKITVEHLVRAAYIYIRQSTMAQVREHLESQRRQYKLAERARELGWPNPMIIDEDLGRSGSGQVVRPGFIRLIEAIQARLVGAIFCLEASRLARSNREWSELVDYCATVKTLLIDFDGIYDPTNLTDRVTLGLKGTMSEYELGLLCQRAREAKEQKAARGELYLNISTGYVRTLEQGLEKSADKRVREAMELVFQKFRELGSANQIVLWFHEHGIELPCNQNNKTIWKLPTNSMILKILKNPVYAGAYAYGRTQTVIEFRDGQPIKTKKELPIEQWKYLIVDNHEPYISWDEYMANRKRLQQNTNKRGDAVKGAVKRGPALLVGLLRCARCSRMLRVRYSGPNSQTPRYICRGSENIGLSERCLFFYGTRVEQLVSEKILQVVEPAAIDAATMAEQIHEQQQAQREQALRNALSEAQYQANRCYEQYNLVDPKNRLVAATLESRWNQALTKVTDIETQLESLSQEHHPLSVAERSALFKLADDLPQAWHHPEADVTIKKRIIQVLIHEIVVDIDADNFLVVTIHWLGGKHTQYRLKRRKAGERVNYLMPETEDIVRRLAEIASDQEIARVLNKLKCKTASGKSWNSGRVTVFRRKHQIPVFKQDEYDKKGLVNLSQAAELLKVYPTTVKRLIKAKIIEAKQVVRHSPWIIDKEQLQKPTVLRAIEALKKGKKIRLTENRNQLTL